MDNFIDEEVKWYALHTYSGYENMVKDNIEKLIENNGLQDQIFDLRIPTVDTIEEKANGKKKVVARRLFPCYLLIKMRYSNELWFLITNTRGVTCFCGPGGRPVALTEDEVRRWQLEDIISDIDVSVGDNVKIISGSLENQVGIVENIDIEHQKVRVKVTFMGREMPVDMNFSQIEKINL